ncbi:hypothetical protein KIPB_011285, partial [Kipferlia bialata]
EKGREAHVLCKDCRALSCTVCGGNGATIKCSDCGERFHIECHTPAIALEEIASSTDRAQWKCQCCHLDGGVGMVEKVLAIRLLSEENAAKRMDRQATGAVDLYARTGLASLPLSHRQTHARVNGTMLEQVEVGTRVAALERKKRRVKAADQRLFPSSALVRLPLLPTSDD